MKFLSSFVLVSATLADASSILEYKPDSALCSGNFSDLNLATVECPNDQYGCTFGSQLNLYAQVNATSDFPAELRLTVSPSLPNVAFTGVFSSYEHEGYSSDVCGTVITAPAGNDAGYSCPAAGLYNVQSSFKIFGDSSAWYGNTYGYNIGVSIRLFDMSTDDEFGFCYVELRVKEGSYTPSTDWAFIGGVAAMASITGVAAAGYMYRKRRVAAIDLCADTDGPTSHFELVTDPLSKV